MLGKLGRLFRAFDRSPQARLRVALVQLRAGWSLQAFRQLQKCADDGLPEAQFELARRYEHALGVVQDLADAVHWYGRAAEQGHRASQSRLGLIYLTAEPAAAPAEPAGNQTQSPTPGRDTDTLIQSTLAGSFRRGAGVAQDFALAARWNLLAAQAGDAEAQLRLGHQHATGRGVAPDLALAQQWLHAAAEQGDLAGMTALGVLHAGGFGGTPDVPTAVTWLRRAADAGHANAQHWLGVVLSQADPAQLSTASSIEDNPAVWLERAAEQGHAPAMHRLGLAHWGGHATPRDTSQAETWLRRAAVRGEVEAIRALAQLQLEQPGDDGVDAANLLWQAAEAGDRRSASLLAELYLLGRGLPRDPAEAARWLAVAGSEARPQAMTALASLHAHSKRAEKGYADAAVWLRQAARHGDLAAKYTLGSLYRQGKGVARDPVQAADWYRQAAQAGSVQAAFYLGLMHAEKDTPLHDDAEALRWSRVAARGGHALAYCNVALMTLTGRGQPADPAQAVAMLETAIGQRNVYAAELLAEWYSSGEHFQPALERARDLLLQALEQGSVKAACHLVALRVQGNDWAVDWARVRAMLQPSDPRANESSGLDPELAALAQLALGQMTAAGLDRDAGDGDNDEKADDSIGHELAALPYFRRAAEAGVADAQAWMGDHLHLHGQSAADALAARHWYRSAARQGHVDALVALAELPHPAGPSEADDDKELFGLLLDAASKGHVPAQRHVAQCYLEGRGCRPYAAAAVRWLERCAGAGDAESQYLLGLCHRHGRGVRADIALARLWIERAAAQDHPQAQRWLDERRKLYLSAAKEPVTRPAVSAS